ncbi:MAG: NAD(P)-binding domain-containing protein [Desulfobacterales bacterium]
MTAYDLAIIGAGPGGLACALKALELGLSYLLLEKGQNANQGIIDSYPRGKKVYPTIPKGESGPFPIEGLMPDPENAPLEEYLAKIEACLKEYGIVIHCGEEFQEIVRGRNDFTVMTRNSQYRAANVVLAFGSNIPVDLGVYGEAKTVARKLDNPADHIGAPTLVLGGGNAAADVVATLSKAKRAAADSTPVYWGNRMEHFKINKDVARDLGEEILLGGHIKILQGAIPRIGEVDEDGVDRLLVQTQAADLGMGVKSQQWMSFPMKHVIACIGTQGPSPVFDRLGLQQITCTEGVCKIGKTGDRLIMLTPHFQTSVKGIYAIGGAISPAYIEIQEEGTFRERKHSNLIFTAIRDAVKAVEHIAAVAKR